MFLQDVQDILMEEIIGKGDLLELTSQARNHVDSEKNSCDEVVTSLVNYFSSMHYSSISWKKSQTQKEVEK